jgi:hypothetical protein
MVMARSPSGDGEARPIDDQVVIVVADSHTGELRACGDLTGYCIGFNPWRQPLAAAQTAPIQLVAHVQPNDPNLTVEVDRAPRQHRPGRGAATGRSPPAASRAAQRPSI